MRSQPGIFSAQEKQWDPEEVLGLINPDRGNITCTAEAMTYGRRCRRAQNKIYNAARMLNDMATMDPLSVAKSDKLTAIAEDSVCYQHGGQANKVCREWRDKLRALGGSRKVAPAPESPRFKTEPDSDSEDEDVKWFTRRPTQRSYTRADIDSMLEQMRRMQETINNMQSQKQREAEEHKRKQAEEERLRKEAAARAQRQRREAEERAKQEREKQEKERKDRENKEREERRKARAKKSTEEAEQSTKQEWADSWQEYLDGWEHLRGMSCREAAPILIPWPVKSGKWEDVTAESVKLFFQKAPSMPSSPTDAKRERFKLMSQESKRWHTDKIMQLFGREVLTGIHGKALDLIAKIVVQLRQDAGKARKD